MEHGYMCRGGNKPAGNIGRGRLMAEKILNAVITLIAFKRDMQVVTLVSVSSL